MSGSWSSILPSWIQPFCTKKLHSFIFTQLVDWQPSLNSAILNLGHLGFSPLSFSSQTHSLAKIGLPPFCTQKPFTLSFWLNLMMAAILNSAILILAILDSASLVFPLKLTHNCQDWFPPFAHKKTSLIHSDSTWWWQPSWYCAMLDSATAILVSDTLLSSLRFTQNHSHSTLTLTQTNLIWFKLIHSHSNWMMAAILNSVILDWANLHIKKLHSFILTQLDDGSHLDILPSWIQTLPSWIQTPCYLLSDSLKNTLTPLWPWLKLI